MCVYGEHDKMVYCTCRLDYRRFCTLKENTHTLTHLHSTFTEQSFSSMYIIKYTVCLSVHPSFCLSVCLINHLSDCLYLHSVRYTKSKLDIPTSNTVLDIPNCNAMFDMPTCNTMYYISYIYYNVGYNYIQLNVRYIYM